MFKNKHLVAALIVTPILAIGGYFVLDAVIGEKPHVAQAGESYPLVALPNCRYSSGKCTLKNNQFKVDIAANDTHDNSLNLRLSSQHALQGAKMALVQDANDPGNPIDMQKDDTDGKEWHIALKAPAQPDSQLRLVLVAGDALYFGETGLAFLHYETAVGKDFRTGD